MKTIIKITMVLVLSTVLFTGCNKYQDGPKFSLLTKKARLTGDWKIDKVYENGTDVTDLVNTSLGANFVLDIEKDGKYKKTGNFPDEGTWKFGEDKDDVYFMSSKPSATEDAERILRLKNKELWLKHTYPNGDVTIVHYVPA